MDTTAKERYVLYHLALIDMERVIRSLDLLAEVNDSHLREALFRDAVISYAKPFSNNRGLSGKSSIRIDASFVPIDLADAHVKVIALRNQLFAHMDIDVQAPNVSVEVFNGQKRVVFSIHGYERVFCDHLIDPLRKLAQVAHSSFRNELSVITQRDA